MRIIAAIVCLISFGPSIFAAAKPACTRSTFDSTGVKISYIEAGDGNPVVLVHGRYSSAEMNWVMPGIFELLAKDHRVVAIDLRGHGESDKPTSEDAYGHPMVDDVVRLMDHLKIEKAQVVGYSLGGIIVMKLLAEHPERVTTAALGGMGWLREGSSLQGVWQNMGNRRGGRTPAAAVHGIGKLAISEKELKAIQTPLEILVGDRDPCKRMYVDPLEAVRKDVPVIRFKTRDI
jgi:hypothetical protein